MKQISETTPTASADVTDLEGLQLFHSVDLNEIRPLLEDCPIIDLDTDEVLIRPGATNSHLYLLLSGTLRVHLHNQGEQAVAMIHRGENVGEISIIDKQPTSAFVIANEPSRILQINDEKLWAIAKHSHAVAYNLLEALAHRLRSGNSVIYKIQELLQEYEYDASIDPLTGLYNRRWLNNALNRTMQRCKNGDTPLALVMIDIDHFKDYNDTYGHVAGDRALHSVARCLNENMRPEDMISRYGGEELMAILPNSRVDDALQVAKRLLQAISDLNIVDSSGNTLPSVTISLGVAEMRATDEPEDLIIAADKAMYRAKRNGRNQVSD